MTDQNAANREKRLVNVQPTFITNPQATELVQPTDRALDGPTDLAQTTAMITATFGNVRLGADLAQCLTVRLRVIGAISIQLVKAIARRAGFAFDCRHIVDQIQQLSHVMSIGCGDFGDDRHAAASVSK